jgi:hypothetical protein
MMRGFLRDGVLRQGDDQDFPMSRIQFDIECTAKTGDVPTLMARTRYRGIDWTIGSRDVDPTNVERVKRQLHRAILTGVAARHPVST